MYINVSLINIRWLSVQLDFVGAVIVFSAAMFATLQHNYPYIFGFIDPGLAGMSISQAFMVSINIPVAALLVFIISDDITVGYGCKTDQ